MTHDELIQKIIAVNTATHESALLAVVELHKPRDYDGWEIGGNWCVGCNADFNYPCPTIQAIEKELACDCCSPDGKCKECGDAQKEELG